MYFPQDEMTTLPRLLARCALEMPHAPAHMVSGNQAITYLDWEKRANDIGHYLLGIGVQPGDSVGLYFSAARWLELSCAYIGIHKAGGTCVLLSELWTDTELENVTRETSCRLTISGVRGAPSTSGGSDGWVSYDSMPKDVKGDHVDHSAPDGISDISYTSGTTGLPKGVVSTQRAAAYEATYQGGAVPWVVPGGICLHAHPAFGSAAQARIVLPLLARLPVFTLAPFDEEALCRTVATHQIPHLSLIPAMGVQLARWPRLGEADLSSVRMISFASARVTESTLELLQRAFCNAQIILQYSGTEATPARTRGKYRTGFSNCVGEPHRTTQISIRNGDSLESLPSGEVGEIWLRLPSLPSRTYLGDPEATAQTFVDGWTRMGDLGFLDASGSLTLVDRVKDVINRGGLKVSAREVELCLETHPAVSEAAVFPIDHAVLGEEVAAAVIPRAECVEEQLRAFLLDRITFSKVPKRIAIVPDFPRTGSGKVRKADLRSLFDTAVSDVPASMTVTPTEELLSRIWSDCLDVEVGPDADFFHLGGDSLRAVQIVTAACDEGLDMDIADLIAHPRLSELASVLHLRTQPVRP